MKGTRRRRQRRHCGQKGYSVEKGLRQILFLLPNERKCAHIKQDETKAKTALNTIKKHRAKKETKNIIIKNSEWPSGEKEKAINNN